MTKQVSEGSSEIPRFSTLGEIMDTPGWGDEKFSSFKPSRNSGGSDSFDFKDETAEYKRSHFIVWDARYPDKIRPLKRYRRTYDLIYVGDSNDRERVEEARRTASCRQESGP